PDIGHQGHEAGPLDGVLHRTLEGGAVAGALAAEELALASAHLLQTGHVLVIDERRPRTTFLRAKAATIPAAPTQLLGNHVFHLADANFQRFSANRYDRNAENQRQRPSARLGVSVRTAPRERETASQKPTSPLPS